MAPYARLCFNASGDVGGFYTELNQLPGVRERNGGWTVPFNAIECVNNLVNRYGLGISSATWVKKPSVPTTWNEIEAQLKEGGEVREFVFDFLTQYQKDAITFGWGKSGVHYWHSTGAGKTITGILTALSVSGSVVIVTRAAARLQFAREIERFLNVRAFVVRPESHPGPTHVNGETWHQFRGRHKGQGLSAAEMAELWTAYKEEHGVDGPQTLKGYMESCRAARTRPFVVIGWEALKDRLPELKFLHPAAAVFDELHMGKATKRWDLIHLPETPDDPAKAQEMITAQVKEAKSKKGFVKETAEGRKMFLPVENRASSAAELSRIVRIRSGLSATPVKDRIRDLWAQLDVIEPNAWGSSSSWRSRYADMRQGTYGMDDRGASNLDELKARLSGVAHILAYHETHRHLPPKRRQSVYVAPEDQVQPLGGFNKELIAAKKRGVTAVLEVKLAMAASKKRKAVLGIVEDHVASGQKVVVFTARRKDCEELGDLVRKTASVKSKKAQVWAAHGGESAESRQAIVDAYMAEPGPAVLIGTGDAFGESLNLDTTDAALFVMLPYTPGQLRQWEGRFHRASTKKPVIIYYVIAENTVDEHIAELIIAKLPSVEKIAEDTEIGEARDVLAGIDPNQTPEAFAESVLASLDL